MTTPDVLEAAKPWMQQCGICDYGLTMGPCVCPSGDPRSIVSLLAAEVEDLREELARQRRRAAFVEREHEATLRRLHQIDDEMRKITKRLWAARMVKVWTNEDGKRFVFADDLLAAVDPEIAAKVAGSAGDPS